MGKKCCGFGHRIVLMNVDTALRKALHDLIENQGVTRFLAGGMGEFDELFARTVCSMRGEYPQIQLCLVVPYLTKRLNDQRELPTWSARETTSFLKAFPSPPATPIRRQRHSRRSLARSETSPTPCTIRWKTCWESRSRRTTRSPVRQTLRVGTPGKEASRWLRKSVSFPLTVMSTG